MLLKSRCMKDPTLLCMKSWRNSTLQVGLVYPGYISNCFFQSWLSWSLQRDIWFSWFVPPPPHLHLLFDYGSVSVNILETDVKFQIKNKFKPIFPLYLMKSVVSLDMFKHGMRFPSSSDNTLTPFAIFLLFISIRLLLRVPFVDEWYSYIKF